MNNNFLFYKQKFVHILAYFRKFFLRFERKIARERSSFFSLSNSLILSLFHSLTLSLSHYHSLLSFSQSRKRFQSWQCVLFKLEVNCLKSSHSISKKRRQQWPQMHNFLYFQWTLLLLFILHKLSEKFIMKIIKWIIFITASALTGKRNFNL